MEKRLYINPPSLLRWQPKGTNDEVMYLDFEPDFLDDQTLRLDINVVFRPIALQRGMFEKADFYIGSTGAHIRFSAFEGRVKNYTRGTPFKVNYETEFTRTRESSVKISPTLGTTETVRLGVGEIGFEKDNQSTFTARFSGQEAILTDTYLGDGVEWEFVPLMRHVIRDYLAGNLFLFVEASWNDALMHGTLELRPSDIRLFGSNRKPIGSKMYKTWLMLFILFKHHGIRLSTEPTKITFKEVE